ncbi:MAG: pilus assembly protein CpaE [Rhodospirillaceae bacterium]|jgi:pilus assembly protein CpaE|nr:pilus assembly protein CpaE [Rhodospirillaceae bacterium]MBT4116741.1 pilus assembly protein CpaE [Rhodospirillaceae bacterium]MBT4670889.1 pilus assembly protein CpaE [Rhodospirillaceae bacterium]MBT4748822.1 pilus assembly protein CpaE [Rhodospirillaceae bacterium]MBT5179428.1 pilus assembly protein CpaE [Rhodospirillaceae bacterium]
MSVLASLKPASNEAQTAPFFASVTDAATRAVVAAAAGDFGWSGDHVIAGGIDQAIEHLSIAPTPAIVIADISGSSDPLADFGHLAAVCDAGVQVLAIGTQNDVALYRDIVGLGVNDYLVKPVAADALAGALQAMTAPKKEDKSNAPATPVTAFVGVRGGAGASTAAISSAWLMAHKFEKKTVLFDLDLNFGTAALMLDLEPGRGLSEALANPDRIDELFLARAMVRQSDNLMVLSAEESLDQSSRLDVDAFAAMNDLLRVGFDEIVWDVPRALLQADTAILAGANRVVLVSDASLAGLRDTKQIITAVTAAAPDARVVVTLAQTGRFKGAEVEKADFEGTLGCAVDHVVPYDAKSLARAASEAVALPQAAPNGAAAKAYLQLIKDVAGFGDPKKSGLLGLLKRG